MFRATMCPSTGEITLSALHLVIVTLCGWLSGMQGKGYTLYTRQSSTQSDNYQVSHRYSYFSCWWAHSCPKHVEKRNKHTTKNCAPSWFYLQDCTVLCLMAVYFVDVHRHSFTLAAACLANIIIVLLQPRAGWMWALKIINSISMLATNQGCL